MNVKIIGSILAADFLQLGAQIAEAEAGGVDGWQVDVMDGDFVANLTLGVPLVEAVRRASVLPLEAHLMIERPERYIETFARAGADTIIVHQESTPNLHRAVRLIKDCGLRGGAAINPATPAGVLSEILDELDLALVMTVNPGFGGQKFLPKTLDKIVELRQFIETRNLTCDLEADGGIDVQTALPAVRAGANLLVAGTAVFAERDAIADAVKSLRNSFEGASGSAGFGNQKTNV